MLDSASEKGAEQIIKRLNLENGIQTSQCLAITEEPEMAIHRHRVVIGYNDDGSEIYKHLQASTMNELNDKIVQAYIDSGRINEFLNLAENKNSSAETNFKVFVDEWMAVYKEPTLKHKTLSTYRGFLRTHIYPAFGMRNIEEITSDDVQRFLNDRKHLAKKTLKEYLALLGQIFKAAIKKNLIHENPCACSDIKNPSDKEGTRVSLESETIF